MGVVQLFRPLFFGGFQIAWLDSLALFSWVDMFSSAL